MKYASGVLIPTHQQVAPHAGAWIEITSTMAALATIWVAPHAGAWIEIAIRLNLHL